MKKQLPALLILASMATVILSGCQNETQISSTKGRTQNKNLNVSYERALSLSLDSFANLNNVGNYFYDSQDDQLIVKSGYSLYAFDLPEGQIAERWTIPNEGPNSIKRLSSYDGVVRRKDRYLLSNQWDRAIYEWREGTATKRYQMEGDIPSTVFFSFSNAFPLLVGQEMIIPLYHDARLPLKKTGAFAIFDISSQEYQEVIPFPATYDDGHWGDQIYQYLANIQYVPDRDQFFVSFPLDHQIYIYDRSFSLIDQKTVAANQLGSFSPLRPQKLDAETVLDDQEDRQYFKELSFYITAQYDASQDKYLRIARKATPDEQGDIMYSYFVVVCDSELQVLGQFELDDTYNLFRSFSAGDHGFLLFNQDAYKEESKVPFDRLVLE